MRKIIVLQVFFMMFGNIFAEISFDKYTDSEEMTKTQNFIDSEHSDHNQCLRVQNVMIEVINKLEQKMHNEKTYFEFEKSIFVEQIKNITEEIILLKQQLKYKGSGSAYTDDEDELGYTQISRASLTNLDKLSLLSGGTTNNIRVRIQRSAVMFNNYIVYI